MPHTSDVYPILHTYTRRHLYLLDRSKDPPAKTLDLVIDRRTLGQGQLAYPSGKACALGHLCLALGFSRDDILGVRSLCWLTRWPAGLPDSLVPVTSRYWGIRMRDEAPLAAAIWCVNDDPDLAPEVREELLIRLFAEAGVALTFTGDEP